MAGDQKKEFGPHLRLQLQTFSLSQTWVTQVSVGWWTAQCPVPGGGHGKGNDYRIIAGTFESLRGRVGLDWGGRINLRAQEEIFNHKTAVQSRYDRCRCPHPLSEAPEGSINCGIAWPRQQGLGSPLKSQFLPDIPF